MAHELFQTITIEINTYWHCKALVERVLKDSLIIGSAICGIKFSILS